MQFSKTHFSHCMLQSIDVEDTGDGTVSTVGPGLRSFVGGKEEGLVGLIERNTLGE